MKRSPLIPLLVGITMCVGTGYAVSSCRSQADAAANAVVASGDIVNAMHESNKSALTKASQDLSQDSGTDADYDRRFQAIVQQFDARRVAIDELADALESSAHMIDDSKASGSPVPLEALLNVSMVLDGSIRILSIGTGPLPPLPIPDSIRLISASIKSVIASIVASTIVVDAGVSHE